MLSILILSNDISGVYNQQKELVEKLLDDGNAVSISAPDGEQSAYFQGRGCRFIETPMNKGCRDLVWDVELMKRYRDIIRLMKPDVVLTFTLKPNILGGVVSKYMGIPYIANINGLEKALMKKSLLQKITRNLYRAALSEASCIFYRNLDCLTCIEEKGLVNGTCRHIPGSGVNLDTFSLLEYPQTEPFHFLFVGKLIRNEGIEEYLNAAEYIHAKYPNTVFHVVGPPDNKFRERLDTLGAQGVVEYSRNTQDMHPYYRIAHCIINPAYEPERMSNVLLESSACGRPSITTFDQACSEMIENGVNGIFIEKRSSADLIEKLETFISIPVAEKKAMGLAGRAIVEKRFDRRAIVSAYMDEIRKIERGILPKQVASGNKGDGSRIQHTRLPRTGH